MTLKPDFMSSHALLSWISWTAPLVRIRPIKNAETKKVAESMMKAAAKVSVQAARSPAAAVPRTRKMTVDVCVTELAARSLSSPTIRGRRAERAGLKRVPMLA